MSKNKIGIVSGMGPLAGADVLTKLLKISALVHGASEDVDYPDTVLVSHGIDGFDNTGAITSSFETELQQMLDAVIEQGANIIGIACNTAHLFIDRLDAHGVTVVNLIDAVAKEAAKRKVDHLLLTSNSAKQQRLYHGYLQKHGVKFSETNDSQQRLLDDAIGHVMAYQLNEAAACVEEVLKSTNTEAIIAGCTELPIAIDRLKPEGLHIVDSNNVLAAALAREYYGD